MKVVARSMKNYAIRHVALLAAFRFGFVIGLTSLFIPGLLIGVLAALAANGLKNWLESWQVVDGFGLNIRLLELLELTDFVAWLTDIVDWGWRFPLLVALGVMVIGGLFTGLTTLLSAATYNFLAALSGGLVVELEEVDALALLRAPAPVYPTQTGPMLYASDGQRWPLSPTGMTLGSAPNSTIVLPGLAPRHAEIRFENNAYYVLHDLSGGQTWVDGRAIQGSNLLKPGFRIRVGMYELVFRQ